MKRKVESVIPNWIFALASAFVLFVVSFIFFFLGTNVGDEAFKGIVKQEVFKNFELSELEISSKKFDFSKLTWSFELKAKAKKVWGLPLEIRDLSISASKKINAAVELNKAIIRFSESNSFVNGGLHLYKDTKGILNWDLTNLSLNLGALEKKVGAPAFLVFDSTDNQNVKAHVVFDGVQIPIEIRQGETSSVVQIPKMEIETVRQRLPLKSLSEIPTSGKWSLASRIEISDSVFTEASTLGVQDALVSLNNVNVDGLQNARGVGTLSVDVVSSENMLNGKVHFNLQKATFELNKGRFFKVDGVPFEVTLSLNQGSAEIDVNTGGNSFLNAEIDRENNVHARLKDFDFALLPDTAKIFGGPVKGFATGGLKGRLSKDTLGTHEFELENLAIENAELSVHSPKLPLLQPLGEVDYWGSLYWEKNKKRLRGKFDFSKAKLDLGALYSKEEKNELELRVQAEFVDNSWKTFEAKGEINQTAIEFRVAQNKVHIIFPNTYKNSDGAILSGQLSYSLCGERLCDLGLEPVDYDLKLADFASTLPLFRDLKLSGKIAKKGDVYTADSFVLRWPTGDQLTFDGTLDKYKKAKLKITGSLNESNAKLSNPFLFFKELPVEQGEYSLIVSLRNEKAGWKFESSVAQSGKKLLFDSLKISQSNVAEYTGRAEADLEPYILRGEVVPFTSSINTKGNLEAFPGLLLRGSFDASLVVASSGLNLKEFTEQLKLRATGMANLDQVPATLLIKQGLEAYAKERQRDFARGLAKCYPQKLKGKFDFDYDQGRWNLSPSMFQGADKDSFVRLQGSLGDLESVNLISHYLPGPKCHTELAECIGDAFPKGGMSFEITGKFKDPETDLDFGFIDQSLERCREIKNSRELASDATPPVLDQRARIEELKNFYNSRNLSR